MKNNLPFRFNQWKLYFDPRMRQLVNRIGKKRVKDAQKISSEEANRKGKFIDSFEPPWVFDFDDRKYYLQSRNKFRINFLLKTVNSLEWMIAVTARQIAIRPDQFRFQFIEYKLTGSNEKNALVPQGLSEVDYLWWRLREYFEITPKSPALITDELLIFSLNMAKLMWDSTDPFFDDTRIICDLIISYKSKLDSQAERPKLVAWSPQGYLAPMELLAVMLPPGPVTKNQWLDALADRVSKMAVEAGIEATEEACQVLDLAMPNEPEEAGQFLVLGNLNLRTHLNCAEIDKDPFPATVSHDQDAQEAIEETNLEMWTDLARAMVSASSLD